MGRQRCNMCGAAHAVWIDRMSSATCPELKRAGGMVVGGRRWGDVRQSAENGAFRVP